MSESIVEFDRVSRSFGSQLALDDVSFSVRRGLVYGIVGANGAGKTTIIKHILGLLRAKSGEVKVFGRNPAQNPVEVLRRVGYLSEDRDLPGWMRIDELMRYTSAHYASWSNDYCQELLNTFQLDVSKKVKDLSKGMRAQVALIAAVAHHPELLILDEPSTGLDAVVRQDILDAVIRAVADDGRTALFSSHLLDEVERMSDHVFIVNKGRIVVDGTLDEIRSSHHLCRIRMQSDSESAPQVEGLLSANGSSRFWNLVVYGSEPELRHKLQATGAEIVEIRPASLEEVFVARSGRSIANFAKEDAACPV